MKNLTVLFVVFSLLMTLNACQQDETVKINPAAEDGSLSFVLNQTQYANYTYVLEEANDGLDMDALTCQQPDYGFTAAVTYYIQASFNSEMTDSVELASSINGEKVAINVKEMNKAILALYEGEMPNPTVAKDVYIRLRAIISKATPSPLDTVPTVKPLFSNVIKLNILPYFMEDLVSYDRAKILNPYYIIGYQGWNNDPSGLGSNLVPLSVIEGNHYNSEGQGTYVYTGYFEASKEFKLIRDVGSWAEQWGNQGSAGINNPINKAIAGEEPANFKVPNDGYYTITLNSITNTVSIVETDITPTLYDNMGLVGEMTEWGGKPDVALNGYQDKNNHVWYAEYTFDADSQCKFRYNSDWGTNWGTTSDHDGDPVYSYVGIGKPGGKNLIQKAGTYIVIFNDIDGFYMFIKK